MQLTDFKNMVIPYKDKLYRLAYRMVGDTMEAEDVVQEALIKIWKKRERLEEIDNKEAWCMAVTRNLAIDKIRARKKSTVSIDTVYHVKDNNMDPYHSLKSKDAMAKIKEIMNKLPDNLKLVLQLREIEGYSYKEIGEIAGFTIDQVKVYIYRARQSMKEQLVGLDL